MLLHHNFVGMPKENYTLVLSTSEFNDLTSVLFNEGECDLSEVLIKIKILEAAFQLKGIPHDFTHNYVEKYLNKLFKKFPSTFDNFSLNSLDFYDSHK